MNLEPSQVMSAHIKDTEDLDKTKTQTDSVIPEVIPKSNMRYKFFDVESTGLANRDEVCQISVIVTDINLTVVDILDEYCLPGVPFNAKAAQVNGLDRDLVADLSKGQTFEQIIENNKMFREPEGAWVYYARSGFDPWICNNTLRSNGFKPINFGKTVNQIVDKYSTPGLYSVNLHQCVLNSFMNGKPQPLLSVASVASGFSYSKLVLLYDKFLSALKFKPKHDSKLHNALFDSFLMFLIVSCKKDVLPRVL